MKNQIYVYLFAFFFPVYGFSAEITDKNFSLNMTANTRTVIVHDSYVKSRKSLSTESKFIESILPKESMTYFKKMLSLFTREDMLDVDFNSPELQFLLYGIYKINLDQIIDIGVIFDLNKSVKYNSYPDFFEPSDRILTYSFINHKKMGRLEIGYNDPVSFTMGIRTDTIGVGGNGVQGLWANYVHLGDTDTTIAGYVYDNKFWVNQYLFTNYLDFNAIRINYISHSIYGFEFGATYSPFESSHEKLITNEHAELLDIMRAKNQVAGTFKYTLRPEGAEISLSVTGESSIITTNFLHQSFRQNGVSIGLLIKVGQIEAVGVIGVPKFAQKDRADYVAAGITYLQGIQKFGVSAFSSANNGNTLQVIAGDFERKFNASLFNFSNKEEKNNTNIYLNCCSYYAEIVGFRTKEISSKPRYVTNSGYLLMLGIRASF